MKDAILNDLAHEHNIAQFVSFSPELQQRFAWIRGTPPNHQFKSITDAISALFAASPERCVNVRSYSPERPKSREFLYGLESPRRVLEELERLGTKGLYTIVNETIDVEDGGVSGVVFGPVVEFAPGDTPRCVEKPGTAMLPRELALNLFRTVYGFEPSWPGQSELRVEFSLHPLRRGYRYDQTVIWETEEVGPPPASGDIAWPNRFSRFVGDKAYGLLLAHLLGLYVPRCVAIPRNTVPFEFGRDTGLPERWIRTCPREQVPGRFTTQRGWRDPYLLMQQEDPDGNLIMSILCQQGVDAKHSGAAATSVNADPTIEGVAGYGESFMVGRQEPETLPSRVISDVRLLHERLKAVLGPVRFEWVHDGKQTWVLQLHRGGSVSRGRTVFPGMASRFVRFSVDSGLEALRELVASLEDGDGVILLGRVGVTSHFGDILRKARVPSRIVPDTAAADTLTGTQGVETDLGGESPSQLPLSVLQSPGNE